MSQYSALAYSTFFPPQSNSKQSSVQINNLALITQITSKDINFALSTWILH